MGRASSSCLGIWLEIPIHPAVSKKSVDLVGCKGVPKHSLLKERKECTKSAWLRASRDSKLRAEFLVRKTDARPPPPPCFPYVFILKRVKVVCFDTLSQGLILKRLRGWGVAGSKVGLLEAGRPQEGARRVGGPRTIT